MASDPLVSFAQNYEDVVLFRALGHVANGTYVDVGGFDPDEDSVTRVFYDRGWRGIDVEPVPAYATRFRERRPDNEVVEAVITDAGPGEVTLHAFGGTGLSTLDDTFAQQHVADGHEQEDLRVRTSSLDSVLEASALVSKDIHFLKIDVEGAEEQVLRSIDLRRWRPWVMVIEATAPNSTVAQHEAWEPLVLASGYTFTLFDGLSRFYVSEDHPELVESLSYPACVLDGFVPVREARLREQLEASAAATGSAQQAHDSAISALTEAKSEGLRWRSDAVDFWAEMVAQNQRNLRLETDARMDRARLTQRLQRVREKLSAVRAERNSLSKDVERLEKLAQRQKSRVRRLTARVAALEETRPEPRITLVRRARHRIGRRLRS